MNRLWRHLLLTCLLLGAPVWAASGLEAVRAEAHGARSKVSELRSRQMGLRGELNRLATRIEELKAQGKGRLIVGGELDSSLKRSQEISGSLGELARELRDLETQAQEKNLLLVQALSTELETLRSEWERTQDRQKRQALVERMRRLRTERESLRSSLPAGTALPELQASASDDPEDLFEQVDALRDSEDKVRQKMRALEARIAEVRQERELDRRMNEFMGDEALFDESDRRLRVERKSSAVLSETKGPPFAADDASGAPQQGGMAEGAPQPAATPGSPAPADPGFSGSTGSNSGGGRETTGGNEAPVSTPSRSHSITQVARGADSRPTVGPTGGGLAVDLETGDLKALQSQLEKLRQAAKSYGQKAEELEKKARALDGR